MVKILNFNSVKSEIENYEFIEKLKRKSILVFFLQF